MSSYVFLKAASVRRDMVGSWTIMNDFGVGTLCASNNLRVSRALAPQLVDLSSMMNLQPARVIFGAL